MKIKDYQLTLVDDEGNEHKVASAPAVEPEESIYADDGFSQEMKYGVCVRSKAYDDILDDMIATGDQFDVQAAQEAKRWLCVWLPSRSYNEDQIALIKMNFEPSKKNWFGMQTLSQWGFYTEKELMNDRNNRKPDAMTPTITWNFREVHKSLDLLANNIRNRAAYYRQRGTPGAPVPSPQGPNA